jgi:predicted RND superfamily exporter protein
MRYRFFRWLGMISYRHYWLVLVCCVLITAIFGFFADKIRVETTFMSMLPKQEPSVKAFQKILNEFGAVTQIIVALDGPSQERVIEVANLAAPRIARVQMQIPDSTGELVTQPVVKRLDFKIDTAYIARHGFMLVKAKDLERSRIMFTNYNLVPFLTHVNDVFESEYVNDSENLTKQEKDAVQNLDGFFQFFGALKDFAQGSSSNSEDVSSAVDAITVGDEYYLSNDKNMLLMIITPTMSINDFNKCVAGVDSLDRVLRELGAEYPDVHFGMTGMHVITRDEVVTGMADTYRNLASAFVIILVVLMVSFRMVTAPIMAMVVLLAGITWDVGITQLVLGRLNLFTAMCSVILLGLGIDYAIHIISIFTELRYDGKSIEDAIAESFAKIGMGLVTGALTTAVAFLTLIVTSFSAFREFGFVTGVGILSCLLASMFFLPSMLVIKEKVRARIKKTESLKSVDMQFRLFGRWTGFSTRHAWVVLVVFLIMSVFLVTQIHRVKWNQNYMDMEAKGLESVRLQNEIVKRFDLSPDNMMVVTNTLNETDRITDLLNEKSTVGLVESISLLLPSREKQEIRAPIVAEIRQDQNHIPPLASINQSDLVEQLHRFSDNIIEMSSMAYIGGLDRIFRKCNQFAGLDENGNQIGINRAEELAGIIKSQPESIRRLEKFQAFFYPRMHARIDEMANPQLISLDMVPSQIRDRYVSKDGKHFLVAIYSSKNIWQGLFTTPFLTDMLRDVPGATGTPVFMKDMMRLAGEQGRFAFILAFIAIVLLLLADFRSIKTAAVAMIPLVFSVIWMLGLMGMLEIKFTIVNVIGLPLILGIGIDDGVHIIHRYRVEGKDRLPYVLSSIGKAILLTSLTTMLGFGSLIPSAYRGYASLGILLTLGIGLCFFMSAGLFPVVLKILWGGRKEHPKFFRAE